MNDNYVLSDDERRAIIVALAKLMKQHMPNYNIIEKFKARCKDTNHQKSILDHGSSFIRLIKHYIKVSPPFMKRKNMSTCIGLPKANPEMPPSSR